LFGGFPQEPSDTNFKLEKLDHPCNLMKDTLPLFSIIIPTCNRPEQLSACLEALSCLDYPRDQFEVIVVDDGSKTPLQAIIRSFCNQFEATLITQKNSGPAAARNAGAAKARGKFLAFTDDDCKPASNWLRSFAARFADTPECAITGPTVNTIRNNICAAASDLSTVHLYSYYNADPADGRFFTSNNLALPATLFRSIGGFNTCFPCAGGEDRELCDRWVHHGFKVVYAPEILVYHAHTLTLLKFAKQHFRYGCAAFRFHQIRASRSQEPLKIEPYSFYLNLLRISFSRERIPKALLLALLLLLSQVLNAAGFFRENINHMRRRFSGSRA